MPFITTTSHQMMIIDNLCCFSLQENKPFPCGEQKMCGSDCWFIEQTFEKMIKWNVWRFFYRVHTNIAGWNQCR